MYKMLLGKGVSLDDMAQVDPQYHSSLMWILENDITDVIENTFTDDHEAFGDTQEVELKPGGASIAVTNENKHEYVQLIIRHRLVDGIVEQMRALKRGFNEVRRSVLERNLALKVCCWDSRCCVTLSVRWQSSWLGCCTQGLLFGFTMLLRLRAACV
jgi:hypothetical protein